MTSRLLLRLYSPMLPLLRRPSCQAGQMAVRDSHVISIRQTHDLRSVVSGSRHRIRFRLAPFRPTMFHSIGLPAGYHHQRITLSQGRSKGLYSAAGLAPAVTRLSYPETSPFPVSASQSRFPLVTLPHFCGLISLRAKFRLRRSVSELPLTRICTASH